MEFSVIICCYNPDIEKLKKTIISIEKQKNVEFEIIISDDGSKVNYLNVLEDWVKKNNFSNINYNFLSKNVGTVKNLISGIEMAKGQYIKVISPGDYLFNEYSLNKYKNKFEKSSCSLLFSRAVYYNEQGEIFKIRNPYLISSENGGKSLKRNVCYFLDFVLGASMACKKEMIKYLYEISEVVRLLEDFPLSYLALINGEKVGFIKDYMIWYEYGVGISTSPAYTKLETDYTNFFNYLEVKYKDNKKIQKSLKCMRILKYDGNKKVITKISKIKPSYFVERLKNKLFRKFRKFKDVDFNDIYKITTLEN